MCQLLLGLFASPQTTQDHLKTNQSVLHTEVQSCYSVFTASSLIQASLSLSLTHTHIYTHTHVHTHTTKTDVSHASCFCIALPTLLFFGHVLLVLQLWFYSLLRSDNLHICNRHNVTIHGDAKSVKRNSTTALSETCTYIHNTEWSQKEKVYKSKWQNSCVEDDTMMCSQADKLWHIYYINNNNVHVSHAYQRRGCSHDTF